VIKLHEKVRSDGREDMLDAMGWGKTGRREEDNGG
jgi:hypothetical protein